MTHRPAARRGAPVRRPVAHRAAALLAAAALGLSVLAGCGSEGADTSCGLDACTVTFDRSVAASVDILGVKAKLIGADGDKVTVEVAGERLDLTVGQQAVQVGGLSVSLTSLTDTDVVIRVAR